MEHVFKTDPDVFDAVAAGMKPWDMRNLSDRNVKVGDTIRLRKTKYSGQQMKDNTSSFRLEYTGEELKGTVKYILHGPVYGMEAGWAVMTVDYGVGKKKEYYLIVLWNAEKQEQVIALTKAESAFEAEDKGKEYAKHWESQGYKFHSASFITPVMDKLESGEIVCVS